MVIQPISKRYLKCVNCLNSISSLFNVQKKVGKYYNPNKNMKKGSIILYLLTILFIGCDNYEYLSQKPPKELPLTFAPGIISLPGRKEEVITFSPDLKEIYYSIEFYPEPKPSFTLFTKYENGKWTEPDTVNFSKGRRTSEPFIAFNGKRIYYFANKVRNQKGVLDICYSEKIGEEWSEPISLSSPPNFKEAKFSLHPCIVSDTSLYFSSYNGEICKSTYNNGKYKQVEVLKSPINHMNIKNDECWGDPYVNQDEDYLIFRSNRKGGYGGSDLYISFKTECGDWSTPRNLGPNIHTAYDELGGDVTPDGKYLTFGRDGAIYWVSAAFIRKMRN